MDLLEQMRKHREELVRQQQQMIGQLNQLQANINAFNGAIEECDYWIEQVEPKPGDQVQPHQ